jgi:pre-rRNA-processing protein TSR4
MAVHVGFPLRCALLEIRKAPLGKVGGQPLWLNAPAHVRCCDLDSAFVCQILAPGPDSASFYRYLYVFQCPGCRTPRVFRSQLPENNALIRENEEEKKDLENTDEWNTDTNDEELLKMMGEKEGKKEERKEITVEIFEEDGKVTQVVERLRRVDLRDEAGVSEIFELMEGGNEGTEEEKISHSNEDEDDDDDEDLEEMEGNEKEKRDVSFEVFRWASAVYMKAPIIRYGREAGVMWYSDRERPNLEPGVCRCGTRRTFECQILPQIISSLDGDDVEFGSLFVYTCPNSCEIHEVIQEDVFYQPSL